MANWPSSPEVILLTPHEQPFFAFSSQTKNGRDVNQTYLPVQQEMTIVTGMPEPASDSDEEEQRPGEAETSRALPSLSGTISFVLWYSLITCTIGIGSTLAIAYTNGKWDKYDTKDWISLFVSFAPLIGLEVTLGIPALWTSFKTNFVSDRWQSLVPWASLLVSAWLCSSILYEQFNPLSLVFIFVTAMSAMGSLQLVGQLVGTSTRGGWVFRGGLTFVDAALWCLLFIPLDYRWYDTYYWFGPSGMDYDWWALAITLVGVIGWGQFRNLSGFGYRLVPNLKDIAIAVGALLILGSIVIPAGLLTGFLKWPPAEIPTFWQVFTLWLENVLTVAITEELFFRMVIMNGINVSVKNNMNGWVGLLVSSCFFGLMHWPRREGEPIQQLIYASLAFVSGILYGQAYRLSGNNIAAAVLAHSLTDTTWAFVFSS